MTGSAPTLPGLHALRFVAAFGVFLVHAMFWFSAAVRPIVPFSDIAHEFRFGVLLFYVVSAFALMHSTRPYQGSPGWIAKFYLKRFWRIAPLFYVMAAITPFYVYHVFKVVPTPLEVAANLLFVNNLVPQWAGSIAYAGWSISVEVLFYFIFPLALIHVRTIKAGVLLAIASVIISQGARIWLAAPEPKPMDYADLSILANLQYFAFGMLAYLVYDRLRPAFAQPAPRTTLLRHAAFAAVVFGLGAFIVAFNTELENALRINMTLWGIVFALLALWVSLAPIRALGWAPLQFLGERSYSLYLVHTLVILFMLPLTKDLFLTLEPSMGDWAIAPAMIATYVPVVLVSALTYAVIERPGMALSRRLQAAFNAKANQAKGQPVPGIVQ